MIITTFYTRTHACKMFYMDIYILIQAHWFNNTFNNSKSANLTLEWEVFDRSMYRATRMLSFGSYRSPGSTFADSSLVVSLFVVQLIVGTVFAFGSSCNHCPWLIPISRLSPCCVPWSCTRERENRGKTGYGSFILRKWSLTVPDWLMDYVSIWIMEAIGHIGGGFRCYTSLEV